MVGGDRLVVGLLEGLPSEEHPAGEGELALRAAAQIPLFERPSRRFRARRLGDSFDRGGGGGDAFGEGEGLGMIGGDREPAQFGRTSIELIFQMSPRLNNSSRSTALPFSQTRSARYGTLV